MFAGFWFHSIVETPHGAITGRGFYPFRKTDVSQRATPKGRRLLGERILGKAA